MKTVKDLKIGDCIYSKGYRLNGYCKGVITHISPISKSSNYIIKTKGLSRSKFKAQGNDSKIENWYYIDILDLISELENDLQNLQKTINLLKNEIIQKD